MSSPPASVVHGSVAKVNDEVAVGEDLIFQRFWWRFERVAWTFFTLIILLDLSGAFGRGPLAHAHAQSADGQLKLEYDRIQRTGTPSIMNITLGPDTMANHQLLLFVSDETFGALGAQRIVPQPAESRLGREGLTYSFPAVDTPALVRLELSPPHAGIFSFRLRAGTHSQVIGKVWVVP